jgi:ATP-dependent DNA ligase
MDPQWLPSLPPPANDRASFIEPCLPSPAPKPPSGFNWIHEIKHDGFRLMAGAIPWAFSRGGHERGPATRSWLRR